MSKLTTPSTEQTKLTAQVAASKVKLQALRREEQQLKAEYVRKDLRIKTLHSEINAILKSSGMLASDIAPSGKRFNAAAAYVEAVETGNKKLAAELFKNHKSEIFALARKE
ncbi:MAG: hypothetical protein K8R57_02970 [Verrucomicrobia bacterium]|nr:hypothetical protein [Verrucomicrobiota bacterium]